MDSKRETKGLLTSLSALSVFFSNGMGHIRGHLMKSLFELPNLTYLFINTMLGGNLKPTNGCFTALQILEVADPETDGLTFCALAFRICPDMQPQHACQDSLLGSSANCQLANALSLLSPRLYNKG